jgi:hypothetical protein
LISRVGTDSIIGNKNKGWFKMNRFEQVGIPVEQRNRVVPSGSSSASASGYSSLVADNDFQRSVSIKWKNRGLSPIVPIVRQTMNVFSNAAAFKGGCKLVRL